MHQLTLQIFLQESSNLVAGKKEDKTRGRVSARSVTKDKILISNSQISEQQNPPPLVTALKALNKMLLPFTSLGTTEVELHQIL